MGILLLVLHLKLWLGLVSSTTHADASSVVVIVTAVLLRLGLGAVHWCAATLIVTTELLRLVLVLMLVRWLLTELLASTVTRLILILIRWLLLKLLLLTLIILSTNTELLLLTGICIEPH